MRTIRILFDEFEASENIARRIVRAFSPGETFKIRDKYFKVSGMRTANETVLANVVDGKYTLVLSIGDPEPVNQTLVVPLKPTVAIVEDLPQVIREPEVVQPELPKPVESPKQTSKSGEYRIERVDAAKVTKEGPPKQLPVAGQVWQTKDTRRLNSPPFKILSVDAESAYTEKGVKISLKRWRNYRLVEVAQQSSG